MATTDGPFRDAVAVVTGGASGLGRALCLELGRRGARVVVTDIQEEGAHAVAEAIAAAGGRATAAVLDVRDAVAFEQLVADTVAAHGRLDYLFNNAGLAIAGEARSLTLDHWRKVLDVNLGGVLHGCAAAYPRMARQGFGHIVNVSSLAGLAGMPMFAPYATSKFAVVGLSISLRAEGADLGVKVSAVCPAFIRTGIFDAGTFVGFNKEGMLSLLPFGMMDVDKAARALLRGVERNRRIIVFPFYARLFWWLCRLSPGLSGLINRKVARDARRVRCKVAR